MKNKDVSDTIFLTKTRSIENPSTQFWGLGFEQRVHRKTLVEH